MESSNFTSPVANLYTYQSSGHRRGRSYCQYGLRPKEENFHRPVPFGRTQEAWFLRPNLVATGYEAMQPAPNVFSKEGFDRTLPDVKAL